VSPSDIDAYWDRELSSRNERYVSALQRMRDVMVFPEFFPAFADLRTDDRGRLWARAYAPPGSDVSEWYVFDDGEWVARLTLDPAFQLRVITGDFAIGVLRDEMGVEFIRMYGIAGPSRR
jgi:hypothetical protein